MSSLSDRQRRILGFIMDFTETHDYPPTIREIGEQVGITSTSVVNYNLAKLEDMNLLTRQREVSRGLSLNRTKLADMGITGGTGSNGTLKMGALRRMSDEVVDSRRLRVPILGKIAAGNPIQVEAIDPAAAEDWIELAEGLLGANQQLFALRVQGDSMIDASVLDGDIVILRHQNTADDGDMVAAWIDGDDETTLKFLYREGRNVRLQPANPNPQFKPIIRPAEKVRINGKVVSVIRLLHSDCGRAVVRKTTKNGGAALPPRRFVFSKSSLGRSHVQEPHSIAHGSDLLGIVVVDLAAELLFEGHDQFDKVQAVGFQIIPEVGFHGDFVWIYAQLIDDNCADALERTVVGHNGILSST